MLIGEGQRRALHERLVEVLGVDQADVLMEHLPPSGWGDVARRSDLEHLERVFRSELRAEMGELRGQMGELRGEMGELRGEMGELRGQMGQLRGQMGELRADMGGCAGQLRAEMAKQSRTVTVSSVALVVGVVGSLVTALVTLR
jgi:hypothetical protein